METNHLTVGISLLADTTDSQDCLYTSGNNNASCLLIVPAIDLADLQNASSTEANLITDGEHIHKVQFNHHCEINYTMTSHRKLNY